MGASGIGRQGARWDHPDIEGVGERSVFEDEILIRVLRSSVLRLQEARRLMLSRMMDAGGAGRQVGYVSASQFSREYARLFGNAPTKDVAQLRQEGFTLDEVAR